MKNEMPLEDQVCALEQARKLAELLGNDAPGSLWVWRWNAAKRKFELELPPKYNPIKSYRAYTGAELGALLPKELGKDERLTIDYSYKEWNLCYLYHEYTDYRKEHLVTGQNEAHAKADLAIQGLTEGWIKKENFKYG